MTKKQKVELCTDSINIAKLKTGKRGQEKSIKKAKVYSGL
jgi:hypothetical protein